MAVPALNYLHTNNASSNLAVAITAAATSVQVSAGQGVLFPNPGAGQGAFITIEDRRIGRMEIVLCTTRVGDTLTVVRGQQGTVPLSFAIGSNVSNRVTAGVLDFFMDRVVTVLDPTLLPVIPPEKLTSVPAASLTGTIDVARLPNIPPARLTSVPAENLTGTIDAARLPNIPAANLPNIPAAKLTSVYAGNIIQGPGVAERLGTQVIPEIPAGLLTSVPAGNLTGVVPNVVMSGNYTSMGQIAGSGQASFNNYIAVTGAAAAPAYAFAGAASSGLFYSAPNASVVLARAGASRLSIYDTHIQIEPPYYIAGNGSGLTSLAAASLTGTVDPARLPTSATERTRILDLMASTPFGGVGSYAFLKNVSAVDAVPNGNVSGANLRYSATGGAIPNNAAPAAGSVWRAFGEGKAGEVTLYLRLS